MTCCTHRLHSKRKRQFSISPFTTDVNATLRRSQLLSETATSDEISFCVNIFHNHSGPTRSIPMRRDVGGVSYMMTNQPSCHKNTHSINCVLSFHHPLDLQVAYYRAWGGKLAIPQCQIHQSFDDFDNCHIEIIVTWRIFFFWHLIFLITTIYFPKIVCTFYYYYIHIVTIFNMYFYFLLHTQPMVYTIYFNYRCSLGIKICFRRRHISNACTSYREITDKYFIFINH